MVLQRRWGWWERKTEETERLMGKGDRKKGKKRGTWRSAEIFQIQKRLAPIQMPPPVQNSNNDSKIENRIYLGFNKFNNVCCSDKPSTMYDAGH